MYVQQSHPTRSLSITDKGARSGGVFDCSYAITRAINELNQYGGGILHIPKGIYRAKLDITNVSNILFCGDGPSSVLILPPDDHGNVMNISHSDNLAFKDFTLDGNRDNNDIGTNEELQNCLRLIGCTFCDLSGVNTINAWMSGIKLGGWAGWEGKEPFVDDEKGCENITIRSCKVYHVYDQGIGVWSSKRVSVVGNLIIDGGWAGISFTHSDYSVASGNISGFNSYLVNAPNGEGTGIAIEGGFFNSVNGNVCVGNNATGIRVDNAPQDQSRFSQNNIISSNVCHSSQGGGQGLFINRSKGTIVSSNIMAYNDGHGVEFSEQAEDVQFLGNKVMSNGNCGILSRATRSLIDGNHIHDNVSEGLILTLTKVNNLGSNHIYNNGSQGISLRGVEHCSLVGNKVFNNSAQGIEIRDEGSIPSMYNTISNNNLFDDQGIATQTRGLEEIGNSDYNLITNNIATGNRDGQITTVGSNTIAANNIAS